MGFASYTFFFWANNTYWATQCAAVRICSLSMSDPPQNCRPLLNSAAWKYFVLIRGINVTAAEGSTYNPRPFSEVGALTTDYPLLVLVPVFGPAGIVDDLVIGDYRWSDSHRLLRRNRWRPHRRWPGRERRHWPRRRQRRQCWERPVRGERRSLGSWKGRSLRRRWQSRVRDSGVSGRWWMGRQRRYGMVGWMGWYRRRPVRRYGIQSRRIWTHRGGRSRCSCLGWHWSTGVIVRAANSECLKSFIVKRKIKRK